MNNLFLKILSVLLSLTLFAWQHAGATTVYQWTDEEGVVHFSDVPPLDVDSRETQEIDFVDYVDNRETADEYSIINQLERMTEWRKQLSEERMAKKQLQLEEQRLAEERQSYRYNPGTTSAVYPSSSYIYPYAGYTGGFSHYKKRRFQRFPGFHGGFRRGGFSGGFKSHTPNFKLRRYKAGSGF